MKRRALDEFDHGEVLAALHLHGWQIQGAAKELGISRPSMYKLIEAHPAIRRPEHIDVEELRRSLQDGQGDIERCAALLLTPAEALRRHLGTLGLAP
jgi:two-component system nitrogen regulation response regulator GlnG